MTLEGLAFAIFLFGLRILNNAIGTVRVILITRGQRFLAAVLAFIEALIFAIVFANVVSDLSNIFNLLAYCLGFSIGGYVGMAIESRFITSYVIATIITQAHGHHLATALRERGFGVTESVGEGRDGMVIMLRSVIARRDISDVLQTVREVQPDAFVSIEEARAIQHGWVRQLARNHYR
ncbi:MAG: DUF2179 domain-containing protein [Chloroflexi bacterium]|nr:DUF2179 domain-containing protein [Chloroflexota bacterium]